MVIVSKEVYEVIEFIISMIKICVTLNEGQGQYK